MMILNPPKKTLVEFLDNYGSHFSIDSKELLTECLKNVREHSLGKSMTGPISELFNKWYGSVDTDPDFSVYSNHWYFCDIWVCWALYSRRYLKNITVTTRMENTVAAQVSESRDIVDLGCGFGLTTQALKEMFPRSNVIGTNLKDSFQYDLAESLGKKHNFTIQENPVKCDLVFASEYFEHFENPLEHLDYIIDVCSPRHMLIANGFGGKAIGHFNYYVDKQFTPKETAKLFSNRLKYHGYRKIKTDCWNNRPEFYEKI